MKWANLAIGSLVGGFSRYILAGAVYRFAGNGFPHGTLVVNLTGCFLIGLFDTWTQERFSLGPHARMLLMIGFCGAFTTFSTLIFETSNLLKDGEFLVAVANVLISVVAGLVLFRLGTYLGKLI